MLGVKSRNLRQLGRQLHASAASSPDRTRHRRPRTSRNAIADHAAQVSVGRLDPAQSRGRRLRQLRERYVQDDFRVSVAPDAELRHCGSSTRPGWPRRNNHLVVGFDSDAVSPLNVTIPAGLDPLHPRSAAGEGRAGLRAASTARRRAGQSAGGQAVAARAACVFNIEQRHRRCAAATVCSGRRGTTARSLSTGYSQTTTLTQNTNVPVTSHRQSVPGAGCCSRPATRSASLSGVSSGISFFDPTATAPRVQQYSVGSCSASCRAT